MQELRKVQKDISLEFRSFLPLFLITMNSKFSSVTVEDVTNGEPEESDKLHEERPFEVASPTSFQTTGATSMEGLAGATRSEDSAQMQELPAETEANDGRETEASDKAEANQTEEEAPMTLEEIVNAFQQQVGGCVWCC